MFDAGGQAQAENPRRDVVRYPYFTRLNTAARASQTKAQLLISPHDAISFSVKRRKAMKLEWADVVKINYPPDGVDTTRLWRIIEVVRSEIGRAHV